jgi:hypothetical protein
MTKEVAKESAQILNGLRRSSRGDGNKLDISSLSVDLGRKRGIKE